MVEYLTFKDVFPLICKSEKKWGMYISFRNSEEKTEEIIKAAPYLDYSLYWKNPNKKNHKTLNGISNILVNECGILLFDTQEEMNDYYFKTIGDANLGAYNNDYEGTARVFAMTCDPKGNLKSENC